MPQGEEPVRAVTAPGNALGFRNRFAGVPFGCLSLLVLSSVTLLSGCSRLSQNYSYSLKPLHVVTYVSSDNRVSRKKTYFGDRSSNVISVTDDATDGLLPYNDADGLVDRITLEFYHRGEPLDFIVRNGEIYADFLSPLREKKVRRLELNVAEILTERFVRQNNYIKTASSKVDYEIVLQSMDSIRSLAEIEVDGQKAFLERGVMKQVGGVYVMLVEVEDVGDDAMNFAVLQVGNQGILLKPGQKVRINVDPATAHNSKVSKSEKINFVFVTEDTSPDKMRCELEDIFHTFLVDRNNQEHVSFYRMIRESEKPSFLPTQAAAGTRTLGEQFDDIREFSMLDDITDQLHVGFREILDMVYGPDARARTARWGKILTERWEPNSRAERKQEPSGGQAPKALFPNK